MSWRIALAAVLALLLGGSDVQAQTAAQFVQLRDYVVQLALKRNEDKAIIQQLQVENAAHRATINQTIAALDQERCRMSRTVTALQGLTSTPPVYPKWVDNVACIDLKSPVPPFPTPLPAGGGPAP